VWAVYVRELGTAEWLMFERDLDETTANQYRDQIHRNYTRIEAICLINLD
jgi:hypothetical protein